MGRELNCYDCGVKSAKVRIRQCDFMLCDACDEKRRYEIAAISKKETESKKKDTAKISTPKTVKSPKKGNASAKKTSSGQWTVAVTPNKANSNEKSDDHPNPNPKQPVCATTPSEPPILSETVAAGSADPFDQTLPTPCGNETCTTKPGDLTCSCFICQKVYHLNCVKLTRRPAKSSNWCCQLCKDVPSLIRQLNKTINILSDWQRSMHDQQQDLKAENKALKEQIKEIIQNQTNQRRPHADKKPQPVSNITESDRQSTDNEHEEITSPWNVVSRKRRNRKHGSRGKDNYRHVMRTSTRNNSTGEYRETAIHRASKHQQPNSREEPVWRRDRSAHSKHSHQQSRCPRNEDQRRSRYNNTRERQRSQHARAVSDETSRFYRTERSYGFATKEPCYNCGLSNHDTNECYFHFPITCRSCGREGHKSKICKWFSEFRNHY